MSAPFLMFCGLEIVQIGLELVSTLYSISELIYFTDILEGSKQLYASRKIRKLLEIVLALGNYMNKGNRGNAFGFKISSLNKIQDTKSSQDRDITMLHYLVDLFDKQVCYTNI